MNLVSRMMTFLHRISVRYEFSDVRQTYVMTNCLAPRTELICPLVSMCSVKSNHAFTAGFCESINGQALITDMPAHHGFLLVLWNLSDCSLRVYRSCIDRNSARFLFRLPSSKDTARTSVQVPLNEVIWHSRGVRSGRNMRSRGRQEGLLLPPPDPPRFLG